MEHRLSLARIDQPFFHKAKGKFPQAIKESLNHPVPKYSDKGSFK